MAGAAPPAQLPPLDPHEASYLFGLGFGEQLHNVGITDQLTLKELTRGVQDGLKGKRSSQDDRRRVQAFVRAQMESSIARNQAAAKDFLARNGREKGIVTTASGLEYKVIAAGDFKAAPITHADTVTVQYRGTLLDGSEFDNSYVRGSPATFPVTGVIPGWQEALVLMKPGAKWRLFVPPDLAYGNSPKPGIPGGSLLIFDVELLSVKSGAATSTPPQPSPTPPQPSPTPPQPPPAPPQPAPAPSH